MADLARPDATSASAHQKSQELAPSAAPIDAVFDPLHNRIRFERDIMPLMPRIRALIRRLCYDETWWDDFEQSALEDLYRGIHHYHPDLPLWPWVRTVVHRRFIKESLRETQHRKVMIRAETLTNSTTSPSAPSPSPEPSELHEPLEPSDSPDPASAFCLSRYRRPRLVRALQNLTNYHREALLLRIDGAEYAEIAQRLRVTEHCARQYVWRARTRLQNVLGEIPPAE